MQKTEVIFCNHRTSINTYSSTYTSFVNDTIAAGLYPDRMALCVLAYKTSHWTSFNSYQLYDVWYVVEYSYEEPTDVTATVKADSGTAVSGDATVQAGTTANVTFEEGTIVSLTAEPADGYVFSTAGTAEARKSQRRRPTRSQSLRLSFMPSATSGTSTSATLESKKSTSERPKLVRFIQAPNLFGKTLNCSQKLREGRHETCQSRTDEALHREAG